MNGSLPNWLARWLGIDASTARGSAVWQLESTWNWAPWATLLLVSSAILWTAILYAREGRSTRPAYRIALTTLRLCALTLLLVMLAQWALAIRITGPPILAIVFDRSASMGIIDRYGDAALVALIKDRLHDEKQSEASRLNLAKSLVTEGNGELLEELSQRYQLEAYFFANDIDRFATNVEGVNFLETVRSLTSDGPGTGATRLGDAVLQVLENARGTPPAGMVVFTDGVTTEGASLIDAAAEARRQGVPILAVGMGSDDPPRDIAIADLLLDDVVFVDDLVSLQIQIKSTGLAGATARVVLRRDGESQPIAEQEIAFSSKADAQTVQFIDRPTKPGDVTYVVEVMPRDDEVDQDNNRVKRTVSVRDEKIRVLLTYGYPSYEFRYLKSLFERDSTITLSTYLQEADPDYTEQDKTALRALPTRRAELFEFDVLVIGDMNPRLAPRSFWENVRAFVVEKGGGAAFIAGPRYLPWLYRDITEVTSLLPIDLAALETSPSAAPPGENLDGFVVRPTPLGLQGASLQVGDSPTSTVRIWNSLAPLYWLVEIDKLKPAAQVLAEHPTRTGASGRYSPVITFQYVGAGRVLFHAVDSTWRWRAGVGDLYFARYWVQTIRALARGALSGRRGAELVADQREYRQGEPVKLRARFFDLQAAVPGDEVTLLLESPGHAARRIVLPRNASGGRVFESTFTDLPEGRYEVLLVEPRLTEDPAATQFTIVAPLGEFARTEMDRPALEAAAKTSRGKFYTFANAHQLFKELPAGRPTAVHNLPRVTIWNQWWLLAAFLTCLTSEWVLRKRVGML